YTIHSPRMRWFIVGLVSLAGLMSPLTANIFFPVIPSIASDLGVTVELINISVLAYMIAQGVSPSFFGAICDVLGRRPTYIVSFIIYIGACAGLANTHKYWLLVVLRVIQAAGSSSVIAIGAGSIGDIAPPSERGLFMSIFGLGPMVGPCIGPIVGGVLAERYGWQALFWFLFVLGALVLLSLSLFLPETLRSMVGDGSIPARGINRSLVSVWQQRQRRRRMGKEALAEADAASLIAKPPKKGWKDVKPFAPLKMFREKDVFFVLTFNSACYTLFYTVTTSTGTTFKDTYHLSETELGLCFIANGAGCLLATFINGPRMTHDYKVVKRQVERRRAEAGFSKEEEALERKKDLNDLSTFPIEHARLRSEPYFFFVLIASTITYGWVLDKGVHLSVPLIMQFFIGVSVTTIFNCTSTLLVDLYPGQSASATAANNLYRCCAGAAGVGFVEPLLNRLGAGWSFTFLSLLCCCFSPLMLLEWKNGMRWRAERAERLQVEQEQK
ncbi:MFS general substrate transporter, partial [Rhodotorula sp. JG-1b]